MFKSWLLNVVGIVFAGAILDMVMPDGKTNKFIKHVFSVFVLYVIISPILSLKFDLQDVSGTSSNLLYFNNFEKIESLQDELCSDFESSGIQNCNLIINANYFDENCSVSSVYVDIVNAEYGSNLSVNEVKEIIVSHIVNKLNVGVEDIVFYG